MRKSEKVAGEDEQATLYDGGGVRTTRATGQTNQGVRSLTEGEIQEFNP